MDEFWDQVRRTAAEVNAASQMKLTLVATSYNPQTHAVKGIVVPHGFESGWVPVTSAHTGNGYGIVVGPQTGSADALDGDVFDVEFENGDTNVPIAKMKHFSAIDVPPTVQSGEILIQRKNGNKIFFAQDDSITISHKNGAGVVFDSSGHVTINGGGNGNLT